MLKITIPARCSSNSVSTNLTTPNEQLTLEKAFALVNDSACGNEDASSKEY